jgi:serine/threonine-protein kinase
MSEALIEPKLAKMKYRVVSTLGTGAGSTILLISDQTAKGKRYALKVVRRQDAEDDIYVQQAYTEFKAAQKLNHPNIVQIYDLKKKRSWFKVKGVELLMEYVDGKTLDELELPQIGQLVLIFCQVASAMRHMHRRGVFHGDLKPSNIMLSKDGQVKLIDFGTAWIRGEDKGRIQGTVQYIAPEQAADKIVDERTDIYNFGATMYRMFTGHFVQQIIPKADNDRKVVIPAKINPGIPGTLNELIMNCLRTDPSKRPAGMFEVHDHLKAVARHLGLAQQDLKGAEDDD